MPCLSLSLVIIRNRKCHQCVQREAVLAIQLDKLGSDIGQAQPPLNDKWCDAEGGRDLLDGLATIDHAAKRLELIGWMQLTPPAVLRDARVQGFLDGDHPARYAVGLLDGLFVHQAL